MSVPDWLQGAFGLPDWFLLGWIAVLGLLLGSFLNVVVHRLPRGESLVHPRSRCPGCGTPVRAWDNVPVLSWLLLGGRCRACRELISPRYPIVEILGAACLLASVATSDHLVAASLKALLLLAMVSIFFIDLDHRIIPDVLTLPGIAAGLVLAPRLGTDRLDALIGAAAGAGLLLLLRETWLRLRGVDALGGGDIKLAGCLGAWLGWQGVTLTLLLGSCVGTAIGLVLIATHRAERSTAMPYGAFLTPAAAVVILRGQEIWHWYLSLGA